LASEVFKHSVEKHKVAEYCAEQGVPCTRLPNATVPGLLFGLAGFSTFQPRENKLNLYYPYGEGRRGLTWVNRFFKNIFLALTDHTGPKHFPAAQSFISYFTASRTYQTRASHSSR
jgi:hypothetical protein